MVGDSQRYDRALAAGQLIYQQFLGDPHKADAGILGRLVFIIMDAMQCPAGADVASAPASAAAEDTIEPAAGDRFRFFCPKCLSHFRACAVHKHTIQRCPHCGATIPVPFSALKN